MQYFLRVLKGNGEVVFKKPVTLEELRLMETLQIYKVIDGDNDAFVYQYRAGVNIAKNIDWDYDLEEVFEKVDDMPKEDVADYFGIPLDRCNNMTTSEIHDYVADVIHHCPAVGDEFFELPDEVILPEELGWIWLGEDNLDDEANEDIADWLSDTYGFCHRGFSIEEC